MHGVYTANILVRAVRRGQQAFNVASSEADDFIGARKCMLAVYILAPGFLSARKNHLGHTT